MSNNSSTTDNKRTRKKYHPDFVLAVALGEIPRKELSSFVPKSTMYKFLNMSYEDFADLIGLEYLSSDLIKKIDTIKNFANSRVAVSVYESVVFIKNIIINILSDYGCMKFKDLNVKTKIVNAINRTKETIGFKRALSYFKITAKTFYNWNKQVSLNCKDSLTGMCYKIWPTQISKPETEAAKKVYLEKSKLGWPISSIWGFAFSNKHISFGKVTFFNVVRNLGLTKGIIKYKKKRKIGIVTSRPNEIWNADVTCCRTKDRIKNYIYLIIDHFSKMILAWYVSTEIKSSIRKDTVKEAYDKYGRKAVIKYSDISSLLNSDLTDRYINLVTDGGPENLGELSEYVSRPDVFIKHSIAQTDDFPLSNSPIEALNKILKHQYLNFYEIADTKAIIKLLNYWIPIYNKERPNISGGYLLTPYQVFNGIKINENENSKRIKQAKIDRIKYNRKHSCGIC